MFPPKSARQLTRQKSGQSRQKCTHNSGDSLCCCTACNAASCSLKSLMAAISELSARHRLNADKRFGIVDGCTYQTSFFYFIRSGMRRAEIYPAGKSSWSQHLNDLYTNKIITCSPKCQMKMFPPSKTTCMGVIKSQLCPSQIPHTHKRFGEPDMIFVKVFTLAHFTQIIFYP